jgi:hypothetical protein
MIEAILALGLWYWLTIVTFSIIVIICLEKESFGHIVLITIAGIVAWMIWGSGGEAFTHYKNNPLDALYHFGGYFAVGAVYSILKWFSFVRRKKEKYLNEKDHFWRLYDDKTETEKKVLWAKEKSRGQTSGYEILMRDLSPKENADRLSFWILYWPWSLFWTIIDDPIRRLVKYIRDQLNAVYVSITKRTFSDIEDDFK